MKNNTKSKTQTEINKQQLEKIKAGQIQTVMEDNLSELKPSKRL